MNTTCLTQCQWQVFDLHPQKACLEIATKQDPIEIEGGHLVVGGNIATIYGYDEEFFAAAYLIAQAPDLYAEIERDLIEQLKAQNLIKGKLVDEQLNASIIRKQNLLAKARGKL